MVPSLLIVALRCVLAHNIFEGETLVRDAPDVHDFHIHVVEATGDERGDTPDEANFADIVRMVAVGRHAPNLGRLVITRNGERGLAAVGSVHVAHGDVDLRAMPRK